MNSDDPRHPHQQLGGIIHTYQKFDPVRFPPPTAEPPDMTSAAFDHMLAFGSMHHLTPEQLADAIEIDPSQIQGLGPSLAAIIAQLEERKRRILATWETDSVQKTANRNVDTQAASTNPPRELADAFRQAVVQRQLRALEQLWYRAEERDRRFAGQLPAVIDVMGELYEVESLAATWEFTGRKEMDIPTAIQLREELQTIDELLEQLREAMKNAKVAIIDMDALASFIDSAQIEELQGLQQQIQDYLREEAARQGIDMNDGTVTLSPDALRIFQSHLLKTIFSDLQAARSGRHEGAIAGDGAVELPRTRAYEFGDSPTHMDIPQSLINAMVRQGPRAPGERLQLRADDIEIHETRNNPKCATAVILDMSGSMRHMGQYINAKRMALALHGLIRQEYPGDSLMFIEMYSFAKQKHISEIPTLMPKPVTIYDPVVRLSADMSDERITEMDVPPHFTNIQHALSTAQRLLSVQDTPNRQIMLLTDGLPTAHFEDENLLLLYPPTRRTEEATMRQAQLCRQDNITINIFLLPSWGQSEEDIQFAHRMAESTNGRVFFPGGDDLDRFVVWDYVKRRKSMIG